MGAELAEKRLANFRRYVHAAEALKVLSVLGLAGFGVAAAREAGWLQGWQRAAGFVCAWLVFGELLPGAIARAVAEFLVAKLGLLMRLALVPALPLGAAAERVERFVERLTGGAPADKEDEIEDEIRSIVAEGRAEGVVPRDEQRLIEAVLRFDDRDVAEVMTPRTDIMGIDVSTSLDEAVGLAASSGHSRMPVYEGSLDDIVGIFYAKDALAHWQGPKKAALREIVRKPFFIPESRQVRGLLEELRRQKVHIAIVIDEYGGTAGLVTIEDIVEELVGEITDEYDAEEAPQIVKTAGGSVEASGRARIDEINEAMGVELPMEEDFDTIAGFISARLGRIPRKGERIELQGLDVEVLAADPRRIARVRLSRSLGEEGS
jgi:CBS domain containing-hemolysin-like protein